MAETLINSLRIAGMVLAAALFVPVSAPAQTLADPTRPPAAATGPQQHAEGGSKLVLQSVMVGPRRVQAIINGQSVRIGDRVGDARVVKITESEVVLRNGKDTQVLRLFPDIEKRTTPVRRDPVGTRQGN